MAGGEVCEHRLYVVDYVMLGGCGVQGGCAWAGGAFAGRLDDSYFKSFGCGAA